MVEAEYRFAVDRVLSLFVAALRIALTRKGGHNPYYRAGMEGNELGCFSPTLLYFSVPLPHALRAPLALCSPLISSLEGSDGLRRSFPTKMERAVSHRDVDSFSAPNEMGN